MVEILLALGKTDPVGGLARCDDDLADTKLHRSLDDVVSSHCIDAERLIVGLYQNARNRGEVDHRIIGQNTLPAFELCKVPVHGQGIKDLPAVGDVDNEIGDARPVERNEIDVVDLITLVDKPRDHMPAGLAGTTGK
ncbi:hypothetical protein D3C72_1727860 [compost metagenome]